MSLNKETLRNKLVPSGGAAPGSETLDALDGHIEADEEIRFRLPGKGGVVHEQDGGADTIEVPAGGNSDAVVTDRKLLFVVAGADEGAVIEIGYTDIKRIDSHDGLLRSKLTVAVWGEGEYRLRIADATDLGAAVQYLREASDCWDRVIATLEDATKAAAEMGERIEAGRLDAARAHREEANEKLERCWGYLSRAEIEPPQPLRERIEGVEREQVRTEIRTRIARAETMITEATHQMEAREYTGSYRNFWYARDHLETALSLARQNDIPEPPEIASKLDRIETRLRHLEVKPRALAQQATERAVGTDSLRTEIAAWQEAFEHFRDALTAGWGTDLDFSGETAELKFKTEVAVGQLIERRCQLATELESTGDDRQASDPEGALEAYAEGIEQLEQALQLASEFRSGEPEQIENDLYRLRVKRYKLPRK